MFITLNKTSVQVIQKPHTKPYVLNLPKKKLENSLDFIETGDYFLNKTLIIPVLKSTINKQDLTKPKSSWKAEKTGNCTKQLFTDLKMIFPISTSNRGLHAKYIGCKSMWKFVIPAASS